jgi:hypothetical protein
MLDKATAVLKKGNKKSGSKESHRCTSRGILRGFGDPQLLSSPVKYTYVNLQSRIINSAIWYYTVRHQGLVKEGPTERGTTRRHLAKDWKYSIYSCEMKDLKLLMIVSIDILQTSYQYSRYQPMAL